MEWLRYEICDSRKGNRNIFLSSPGAGAVNSSVKDVQHVPSSTVQYIEPFTENLYDFETKAPNNIHDE